MIAELINDDFDGPLHRPFSWKSLSGLNRTTANVSKVANKNNFKLHQKCYGGKWMFNFKCSK